MALKTPEQYIDSIKAVKHRAFIAGKRIEDVTQHPNTKPVIDIVAKTYELALNPKYEDLLTLTSPLTGEKISRWCHVPGSIEDLEKRRQMNILMSQIGGTCHARCVGTEAIHALAGVTYEMDQKLGTEYHARFKNFLRYMQENDLTSSEPQTDVKGDRSKGPLEQEDPDVYVHIVERRSDGIVIRGAKAHQEGNIAAHYHLVFPSRPLRKGEEDYAVMCAVPAGSQGMTYICQDGPYEAERREAPDINILGNPVYGNAISSMTIFDNVFVPSENVFMCGEIEFMDSLIDKSSKIHNMVCRGACKVGFMDLIIGAAQTIAEYNGIARASHVVDKITEMIRIRETTHACATAAVLTGKEEPEGSGAFYPEAMASLSASLNTQYGLPQIVMLAADLAGGLVVTMPSELELTNPETSEYVKKYLKGVASVPTEDRLRMLKYLQYWVAGPQGARMWQGGVGTQVHRMGMYRLFGNVMEEKKQMAKDLAGIKK